MITAKKNIRDNLPDFKDIWEPIEVTSIHKEMEDAIKWVKNLIKLVDNEEKLEISA